MNKWLGLSYSLANYERKHIYLFNVMLGLRYKITFYNKTYKSLHLKCSCGLVSLEVITNSEHKRKTICKNIKRLSLANEYKSIFYNFMDDIVFKQVSDNLYNNLLMDIFALFLLMDTWFAYRNFLDVDDLFHYDNLCTFCEDVLLLCYRELF